MVFLSIVLILLILIFMSIPVASVLGILTLWLDQAYTAGRMSLTFGGFIWDASTQFILISVPLFILLGEIVLRAGLAEKMYVAVAKWLSWLPGGLMHANIGSSAIFAATSGSSVATAATIGTVAYPEIEKRGYKESLFLGSIAAGGTLGILIPPSVILIVYGVLTQTSIPELYLAGILPGILLFILFSAVIVVACLINPSYSGKKESSTWSERMRVLLDLVRPFLLFLGVVGSIYASIATPTEAASFGVVFALGLAWWEKKLTVRMLLLCFENTVKTTAMIMLIIFAAMILNVVIGYMGVIQSATAFIQTLGLSPLETLVILVVFYLLLGMFMETFSMMLTTIGLVFPLMMSLGYDAVWFGILLTILMEIALITPPIGVNLFVVQGIRSKGGAFNEVCIGALPFVAMMLLLIVLITIFPEIVVWLPNKFY